MEAYYSKTNQESIPRVALNRGAWQEALQQLSISGSRPGYRVLALPELLRWPRINKPLRNENKKLRADARQRLDERCLAQSDSRQSQNTTTRPFVKPTQIVLSSYEGHRQYIAHLEEKCLKKALIAPPFSILTGPC
jgi:hypothetical protein